MEAPLVPSEEFFQGLEKYFANDLEGAKNALTGDDLFSKSLLALVDVKADDGSKDAEIQARIDAMDFKGNDIALMFCVFAQEYGMHMTKARNLLLKRFGKEEKVIGTEPEEMPELEEVKAETNSEETKSENKSEETKSETKSEEAKPNDKSETKSEEEPVAPKPPIPPPPGPAPTPAPVPQPKPPAKAEPTKQVGGKRVTRKASSSKGASKKRPSRGKA